MASMMPFSSRSSRTRKVKGAFPTQQLFVLSLCRICEPIAFMSIFPYVYYMVASFRFTHDEKAISMYAGMITSAFAFAEFSTGVLWGRISDRVGRKPVLLTGLAGTGLSMLIFGLSPNFTTALIARALGGFLNGNIGVINTTVAEVVTQEKHQSRAFSIMPSIWCIGSIVGAGLGGALADPVHNYPGYFDPSGVFARFPYLLPNLVCCVVVLFSLIVGLLFLEESHEDKKTRRDFGVELGDWLLGKRRSSDFDEKVAMHGEYRALRDSDDSDDCMYSSNGTSPALLPSGTENIDLHIDSVNALEAGATKTSTAYFTRRVVIIIVSYAMLAFHTISADQLLPVFLSLPKSSHPVRLPFQFSSGFDLSTKHIGYILSAQGVIQTLVTLFVFPFVSHRLGALATFRLSVWSYPLLWLLVPYAAVVPTAMQMPLLYFCVVWKVFCQAFAYPPLQILLANSAPSKKILGTLNGSAASLASLARAFGPTLSGLIQSLGLGVGCIGLPWWTSSLVASAAAVLSIALTREEQCCTPDAVLNNARDENDIDAGHR